MAVGWKRMLLKFFVKVLLLLHLILFPVAVLLWGKGYAGLARHLHEGVFYEITAILSPYRWYVRQLSDLSRNEMFSLRTDILHVGLVNDPTAPRFAGGLFIAGRSLERTILALQRPEVLHGLVWIEGGKRAGNKALTLIAYGTTELEGIWALIEGESPYHGSVFLSQRIYNLDHLWLLFYTARNSAGLEVAPFSAGSSVWDLVPPPREMTFLPIYGSPAERWVPKGLTPIEILERVSAYRPGVMPIDYRLKIALSAVPAHEDILWFPPVPGGSGILEYHWIILFALAIVTTPYRIFFYLPLMLSPRLLVWPVAVLWAMLWVASWVWIVAYRRARKVVNQGDS